MAEEESIPVGPDDILMDESVVPLEEEESPEEEEPIKLVEDDEASLGEAHVRAFGQKKAASTGPQFKRPLNVTGQGATRCRVFYSKIADSSLRHMEEVINEWADSEEIDIKHVGHVIGTMEGKHPVPNVVVFVWY